MTDGMASWTETNEIRDCSVRPVAIDMMNQEHANLCVVATIGAAHGKGFPGIVPIATGTADLNGPLHPTDEGAILFEIVPRQEINATIQAFSLSRDSTRR